MTTEQNYLLAAGDNVELERLRLQARVWEPETETWLDDIKIQPGWQCIDLGCGAMGILGPLARRVGSGGKVVGLDRDSRQLAGARAYVADSRLDNIEIVEGDAYRTRLPDGSFDLVHVRFVFAPVGRDDALLAEMLRIAKPGGVLAIQEPDSASWSCFPPNPAWDNLKATILAAFRSGGGDFDAGRRTFGMLRRIGLEDVRLRAAVVAMQDSHPYMRLPIQFATTLRARILDSGLMTAEELDAAVAGCEAVAKDPDTTVTSFVVTQVWGRKPT
jgi:SAM-dependent methyltransferase